MSTYGIDIIHPLRELQEMKQYELGVLAKLREKFSTTETEHDLVLPILGGSLPKDASYFRRFTVIAASDSKKVAQQAIDFKDMLHIFKVYLPGYVVHWFTDGHNQVYTDCFVENVRQEYLFKQNYCAELARKKWVPPIEGTRFCAYCLIQINPGSVKKCGGCKKRAYCSKACQIIDWTSKDGGQNHKYWCKVGACEEGVDWEVVQVPGKGLGIVAKTFIPKNTRVIVEADRLKTHPRIVDLMPIQGTMLEKVYFNCISLGDNIPGLGIRTSRLNHACGPNTSRWFDKNLKAIVMLSSQDIHAGDEITMSYQGSYENERDPKCIERLSTKWGITCTAECLCHDPNRFNDIQEYNELEKFLTERFQKWGLDFPKSKVDRYLKLNDILHLPASKKKTDFAIAYLVLYGSNEKDKSSLLKSYKEEAKFLSLAIAGPEGACVQEMNEIFVRFDELVKGPS